MTTPAWVRKRDGRLVAFEADKISRSLFAASEAIGRPDAFLSRELTDGVLHFLSDEAESGILSTADIAEVVAKVVRELGQPALARAYADRKEQLSQRADPTRPVTVQFAPSESLSVVLTRCRRAYALNAIFTRDLVAAHQDGLLTLEDLDAPLELSCSAPVGFIPTLRNMLKVREHTAGIVAIDGAEYIIADQRDVIDLCRDVELGLQATGLRAVVNLNAAEPPPWMQDLAEGPLFPSQRSGDAARGGLTTAEAIATVLSDSTARIRIDWHLSERDFALEAEERLHGPIRAAALGAPVAFVFDRPRRPLSLAEGIDRTASDRLMTVELNLPRLAELPGVSSDPTLFLQKLGSLARMAMSAAAQKREFFRCRAPDRSELARGFLLERARLMVAPIGLDAAVKLLTGKGLCDSKTPEFGRQIIQRLRDVLREDGRTCVIDVPGGITLDPSAPIKAQLRAAGALHAIAEGGTIAVPLDGDHIADWLRMAWSQTEVGRVCFVRPEPAHRQLTLSP